ncbi:hypothetical protein TMRO357_02810 [Alteriqipengyuania sp. 357]
MCGDFAAIFADLSDPQQGSFIRWGREAEIGRERDVRVSATL